MFSVKDKILPCGCKIQPSGFNNIDIRKDGIGKAIEKSGYQHREEIWAFLEKKCRYFDAFCLDFTG